MLGIVCNSPTMLSHWFHHDYGYDSSDCCAHGVGRPVDSGISLQVVRELGPEFPLFGVCMGHQCIGEAFGGECFFQQP